MMRRRGRTDRDHAAIMAALRKVGCQVFDLSSVGRGCPDLLVRHRDGIIRVGNIGVYYNDNHRLLLLEVKTDKEDLTPDQVAFHRDWPETIVVRSVEDALRAVGITGV